MAPIFVFGTGRCGSTHIQRLISLRTHVWIWGEHAGFLRPLLSSLPAYETSGQLQHNVFSVPLGADYDELVRHAVVGTPQLPWLNRLKRDSLRQELRYLIDRLFRTGLPESWTEWGFKEILYGSSDRSPELLLDLFPRSRATFSFRSPKSTIESMLRTWTPDILKDGVPR